MSSRPISVGDKVTVRFPSLMVDVHGVVEESKGVRWRVCLSPKVCCTVEEGWLKHVDE